jgi:hypothetical protein
MRFRRERSQREWEHLRDEALRHLHYGNDDKATNGEIWLLIGLEERLAPRRSTS